MENEIKITYLDSDSYNNYIYLLSKEEKGKQTLCSFRLENVPKFIVDLFKESASSGWITIKEKKKNFSSSFEYNVYSKWNKILEDESKKLKNVDNDEKKVILKEDKELLYGKFDYNKIMCTESLYDINKFAYILDKYNHTECENMYDGKRMYYTKQMYECLEQAGLLDKELMDIIGKKFNGHIDSSLDFTYLLDDFIGIVKPTIIENNERLLRLWNEDIKGIRYTCPYAINPAVVVKNNKINNGKTKVLK